MKFRQTFTYSHNVTRGRNTVTYCTFWNKTLKSINDKNYITSNI